MHPKEPIDFKFVEKVDTRRNFIIKCEDNAEFESICQLLGTKTNLISFEKFEQKWQKRS